MDILKQIRAEFGPPCPLRRVDEAAAEAGLSKWTFRRIVRNSEAGLNVRTLRKIEAWQAQKQAA